MTANELKAVMAKLDRLLDENDRLRAERARLREALSWWLDDVGALDFGEWLEEGCKIARAALKGGGDD